MRVPSIKAQTVSRKTVLEASRLFLKNEGVTRRSLAETLGVSVMTAGKLADAWMEAGLLEERQLSVERGRSPGVLHLSSQSVAWTLLRMEERGCSFLITDPTGRVTGNQYLSYDAAMSPEGNEAMVRGRWHALRAGLFETCSVVGLGVILRECREPYRELAILEGIGAEADLSEREECLTAEELSTGAYGETALYLQMDREVRTLLSMGKEWRAGRITARERGRQEMLIEEILHLATFLVPDCIVAESRGWYAGDAEDLLAGLAAEWRERREEPCPRTYVSEEMTLAESAMLRRLNERLAGEIAERLAP